MATNQIQKINNSINTKKEEYKDCLPCRLTGALFLSGLGMYSFYQASPYSSSSSSSLSNPATTPFTLTKAQKFGRISLGLVFTSLAIVRMLV